MDPTDDAPAHGAASRSDGRTALQQEWVGTMQGASSTARTADGHVRPVVLAHRGGPPPSIGVAAVDRRAREEHLASTLSTGATLPVGVGAREVEEEPDPFRTCFERDRDRILHSTAFRRLAGKTQVFVFPDDHQRTRLTHALEVAQVAGAVARALGLNVELTEAIALGHDCGHGPGGHASADAFAALLPEGYHHATWGADVVVRPLNLCVETLDGIRNHSWSRPTPRTPEGVVVSWADRCAYSAHDLEDAISAGIVSVDDLPPVVVDVLGRTQREQLSSLIGGLIECTTTTGVVGMDPVRADALAALRAFNYERIYDRPASRAQGRAVVEVLTALVETCAARPDLLPDPDVDDPLHAAVDWVAGMTDRYAFATASRLLDWPVERLPQGFDLVR